MYVHTQQGSRWVVVSELGERSSRIFYGREKAQVFALAQTRKTGTNWWAELAP